MTKIFQKMYRQGDILLKEIEALPPDSKKKENKTLVEGETTGHAHVIEYGTVFETLDPNPRVFVKASQRTRLVHEEHSPIKVAPGLYEVIRQREYLGKGKEWHFCC